MICYLVTKERSYTMQSYLDAWGHQLSARVIILAYEDLPSLATLPIATYIFSDLERLDPQQLAMANQLHMQLSQAGYNLLILNNPARTKRRFSLLKALYDSGMNRFRAYWLTDSLKTLRFPVFLREENDHHGNISALINTQWELDGAIMQVALRGFRLHNVIVVEFYDTSNEKGIFQKYSAFVIGNEILPRHIMFSKHWMIKNSDIINTETIEFESKYLNNSPHTDALRDIARLAGITYGRIDYSISKEGALQAWEINTNPTILQAPGHYQDERVHLQQAFASTMRKAIDRIDCSSGGNIQNPLLLMPDIQYNSYRKEMKNEKHRPMKWLVDLYGRYPSVFRPLGRILRMTMNVMSAGNSQSTN